MSGATSPRAIQLNGCFNFRDLGGLPAWSGTSIRRRMLFRSDALGRLDRSDQRVLARIGLRTVIDLRTPKEVEQHGLCAWYDQPPATHATPLVAWESLPTKSQSEDWCTPAPMIDAYHQMLAEGRDAIANVLSTLADDSALPAVVHCTSGRDRTAIVVAVLLGILGVPDQQIAEDYALSAAGMARSLAWMRAHDPVAMATIVKDEASMVYTPPEVMLGFLDAFRRQYGSFERYVDSIDQRAEAGRLRRLLTVGG
ncbi:MULTISPECIES: tyrosine-protein phosphatase [unclassified Rhodococcus (in: high G+C Gram-positive bacteria)]|uniref:tyrosine-protein phosphatase n=1 Tax=unclassified Rhodococcus (in: high G+C Gram-positive bacteria) TaxID=192944 RepID=UPI00163B23F8|nr:MULTISPECIES: tyrosine-protein phosphatase [unclassified Rhodococcus (in: high G+C Gram-positive bacteria)]MBC2640265.1 tyrosine-protein phosphatase [Rhodococcus sp. 3A]MBC2894989.1 tyrosine-protein phosphatase [Rhodococcus sp. 4CII]